MTAKSGRQEKDIGQAVKCACLLLKYRPRSRYEITQRLKSKEYPRDIITAALIRLESYGYIDDAAFARLFVQSRVNQGWGRRRIAFALKRLGVDEALIEKALPDKRMSLKALKDLVSRKAAAYKRKKNPRQSLMRFLTARGFDYDQIISVLEDDVFML